MYNEVIDLLEANFQLTLLYLIYDILANEIDHTIWLMEEFVDANTEKNLVTLPLPY
jgi:hypothetical protein